MRHDPLQHCETIGFTDDRFAAAQLTAFMKKSDNVRTTLFSSLIDGINNEVVVFQVITVTSTCTGFHHRLFGAAREARLNDMLEYLQMTKRCCSAYRSLGAAFGSVLAKT